MPADYAVHGELAADGETVILFGAGDIKQAVGRLRLLTPSFGATKPPGGLQTKVSWPLLVQLAAELGPAWVPGPKLRAWLLAQVGKRNALPSLISSANPTAPPPRAYQVAGAEIIAADGSALVFDDPGTGKTLTTLLGLMELRARGTLPLAGPMVVVCPSSVIDSWIGAAQRWTNLSVKAWRGSASARRRLLDSRHDLYVTSYGIASRDADPTDRHAPLIALGAVAVVIDECHKLKNQQSLQSKAVRRLARGARTVVALSGTPITHHTGDLWPTLNALNPHAWPSRERFVERYLDATPTDYTENVLGLNRHTEPEFRMSLQGQYRRLSKDDVLPELPPKIYSERMVTIPAAARKAYDSMRDDMIAELEDGQELPAMTVMSQLQRLLQLACASADVSTSTTMEIDKETGQEYEKEHIHVQLREPSWKVDAVMEVLAERPGKSSVVFAPSAQLVRITGERAAKDGYRVGYIIGGQTARERTAQVDAFQAGKLDVLCVTTGAGGVGITLTAASTVIFVQRPWSYVEASQSEDRCHRIGSEIHDSIEIIDIVAVDSVDADVRATLKGKAGALAELLEDPRILTQCLGGRGATQRS